MSGLGQQPDYHAMSVELRLMPVLSCPEPEVRTHETAAKVTNFGIGARVERVR
jgi:hypothetical protein